MTDQNPRRDAVLEAIDGFRTTMLTTVSPEGVLHARPMVVASREDNVLWFATDIDSTAVDEVRLFEHANVTFQSPMLYVSVSGPAAVVDDPSKIAELWNDTWAAWFPSGRDDPDLVLLRLEGRSARMWDLRGAKGIKAALRVLTSFVGHSLDATDRSDGSIAL